MRKYQVIEELKEKVAECRGNTRACIEQLDRLCCDFGIGVLFTDSETGAELNTRWAGPCSGRKLWGRDIDSERIRKAVMNVIDQKQA
jgi:hypothetical protein